jgi:hypothetical protein
MQTELTTTPHPHDPHADDLTWSQAEDVLRYFTPPGHRLHWHVSSTTLRPCGELARTSKPCFILIYI